MAIDTVHRKRPTCSTDATRSSYGFQEPTSHTVWRLLLSILLEINQNSPSLMGVASISASGSLRMTEYLGGLLFICPSELSHKFMLQWPDSGDCGMSLVISEVFCRDPYSGYERVIFLGTYGMKSDTAKRSSAVASRSAF